jgi:hypothetical protein
MMSRDLLDLAAIFSGRSRLLVSDIYEDERWPRGLLTAVEPPGADIRAVAGARLNLKGKSTAYLLVGSIGPDIYTEEDVELLVLLGGLILPQIAEFLRVPEPKTSVPNEAPANGSAELLLNIAVSLASATDSAGATRLVASEGRGVLPFESMVFVLKLTEGNQVVVLQPGDRRAALMSRAGTTLADVLSGGLPYAVGETSGQGRLVVPLQLAGRVHGALLFTAPLTVAWNEEHVRGALALADIVASHLDLLRRSTFRAPPYIPGWKRTEKFS